MGKRVLTVPSQDSHDWIISNQGELLGDLWLTRNIDLESSRGKVRLAERIAILQDGATDQTKWGTQVYPRAFIRTSADGTDRWWGLLGKVSSGSAMYNTSGTDPTVGWAQDALALSPTAAVDSMDIFLQAANATGTLFDRLIVPTGASADPSGSGDLSMLSGSNVRSFAISSTTDATPIVVTLTISGTDSGIFTGNQVTISGVTGSGTGANGTWVVTRVSAFVFSLNTSVSGTGTANNGTAVTSAWKTKWWTGNLGQPQLSTAVPIIIKKFNINKLLLVCEGSFVHTINGTLGAVTDGSGAAAVSYKRLVFPSNYVMNCVVATPDYSWFFLCDRNGGDAIAVRWDGGEASYETPIPLYDSNIYAAVILDGIPYCINGKGQLLKYDGNAFSVIDVLPITYQKVIWGDGVDFINSPGHEVINRNGIAVIDGMIHVLLNANVSSDSNEDTFLENFSSGIWCYNPTSGWYCKYTLGQYRSTNIEWGSKAIINVGGLTATDIAHGRFLAGAIIRPTASSQDPAIFISKTSSSVDNRGQIVTSQIHIPSIATAYTQMQVVRAVFQDVAYSFERFMNSTDRLIIKMRTYHDPNRSYKKITVASWVTGGQSFTVSTANGGALANARIGDEIEIYVGQGAGATAHITSIVLVSTTYTVTLDEAIPNVANGSVFECYLNNWTKITTVSSQMLQDAVSNLMRNSSWLQLKLELRGTATSPEFKDFTLGYIPLSR